MWIVQSFKTLTSCSLPSNRVALRASSESSRGSHVWAAISRSSPDSESTGRLQREIRGRRHPRASCLRVGAVCCPQRADYNTALDPQACIAGYAAVTVRDGVMLCQCVYPGLGPPAPAAAQPGENWNLKVPVTDSESDCRHHDRRDSDLFAMAFTLLLYSTSSTSPPSHDSDVGFRLTVGHSESAHWHWQAPSRAARPSHWHGEYVT